jgi:HEPN domain-containing protein
MKETDKLVELWIEKANHDFVTAKLILKHIPDFYDTLGFHCQQAVEKYLKAYLISLNIEFKPKHNLSYLLDLISQKVEIEDEIYDMAEKLEQFAVELRYPDIIIHPDKKETAELMHLTEKIINNIKIRFL